MASEQEALWVPMAHNMLGISSIKDPGCAVSADEGNPALLDPVRGGRLFAAIAHTNPNFSVPWPGSVRASCTLCYDLSGQI